MSGVFLPAPSIRRVTCALFDAVVIGGTLLLTLALRFSEEPHKILGYEGLAVKLAVLILVTELCLYYNGLYEDRAPRHPVDLLLILGRSLLVTALLLSLVYYAFPGAALGRGLYLMGLPLSVVTLSVWRMFYYWVLRRDYLVENVLIVGTGHGAKEVAREALRHQRDGYRILGFVAEEAAMVGQRLVNPAVVGTYDELPSLCEQLRVDSVVVALEDRRGKLPVAELLRCRMAGVRVEEAASFYESVTGQIPVRSLRPSWLIFSQGFNKPRFLRNSKQAVELLAGASMLVLTAPVLLLACLAVWLEGGRPVLYRQERVGERGKPFTLYKLRTMRQDAEKHSGPVWAAESGRDPRVTRVGRFLRKSRLDELPQLINIIRGEMSFVGPRPERPLFVEQLQQLIPYYGERHAVKPGITGWAQVKYGYGASVEDAEVKLRYDLYYIKHMNLLTDVFIALDTAKVMLFGRGAR
jgi:sugar transferase (PEP-CTERM system associated)